MKVATLTVLLLVIRPSVVLAGQIRRTRPASAGLGNYRAQPTAAAPWNAPQRKTAVHHTSPRQVSVLLSHYNRVVRRTKAPVYDSKCSRYLSTSPPRQQHFNIAVPFRDAYQAQQQKSYTVTTSPTGRPAYRSSQLVSNAVTAVPFRYVPRVTRARPAHYQHARTAQFRPWYSTYTTRYTQWYLVTNSAKPWQAFRTTTVKHWYPAYTTTFGPYNPTKTAAQSWQPTKTTTTTKQRQHTRTTPIPLREFVKATTQQAVATQQTLTGPQITTIRRTTSTRKISPAAPTTISQQPTNARRITSGRRIITIRPAAPTERKVATHKRTTNPAFRQRFLQTPR